jgi:hypothetical protein
VRWAGFRQGSKFLFEGNFSGAFPSSQRSGLFRQPRQVIFRAQGIAPRGSARPRHRAHRFWNEDDFCVAVLDQLELRLNKAQASG